MTSEPKRILLVSNRVMHYRVSVYNYFHKRFAEQGWEWRVLTNQIQAENQIESDFPLEKIPFHFKQYRQRIKELKPAAVVIFLHLKDRMLWPLIHWLKLVGIPVIFWTKTRNLDDPDNRMRNYCFNYVMNLSDGLVLYTDDLRKNVPAKSRHKAFPANNTINFHQFPEVGESKEEIKRSLNFPFDKVVLFVGRIGDEGNRKKVDHLVDIFRELDREDLGLVIVGSGMPDVIRARMNPRNTRYLGEVQDPDNLQITRIFSMADICSIPGHVGLGLNQAMYHGLPMITEEGIQPPEICYLKDGRNGFIVGENDVIALKERISYLADNKDILVEFSQNARADILKDASIEGMFKGFLDCVKYVTECPNS